MTQFALFGYKVEQQTGLLQLDVRASINHRLLYTF